MGKIVKFCNSCNESFAEKFEYCPNCGEKMQAFEMNPVKNEEKVKTPKKVEKPKPVVFEHNQEQAPETDKLSSEQKSFTNDEEILELDSVDEKPNSVEVAPATFIPSKAENFDTEELISEKTEPEIYVPEKTAEDENVEETEYYSPYSEDTGYQEVSSVAASGELANDDFHVHFVREKNVKQRNLLLLASMIFMVSLSIGAVVHSLFAYNLDVGSIDEELISLVPLIDETPMNLEEEIEMKKDKAGGGGGGGGREEETPTSKGRLAPQTRQEILVTPTKTIPIKENFELKTQAFTEGDEKPTKQTDERYGDPTSKYSTLSDGLGSGGGQGSGKGTGQGSGEGTGRGSGKGSGSGGGLGDGNGDGTGPGGNNVATRPTPEPRRVGPSRGIELISKPQPRYTEEARKNNYQGSVTLRVTFLPNGRIGSVAPVNRLPYGLTEQAIAAARRIQFKPAMRNGQPIGQTKRIQYTFTIY